ncbi:MAG TPA: His-Xaa-Ser system protein HxsD [Terriglobales bacterium]|nr:His-Xaa-Ser system protein HxsD [Terriglobales bacterium]
MADAPVGEPSRLGFTLGDASISFSLDETVYPLEAIYGAAYLFLDRCFVYLTRSRERTVEVRLTAREAASIEQLDTLAGELVNELLAQVARLRLAQSTARLREYYTAAALRAATQAPSIEDLLAELESEELGEDPLEIMVPWEEKSEPKDPESSGG